jgi:hypothetical protein
MIEKLKYFFYIIFAYLNLDHEVFGILMILMLIDSGLGALKSVRVGLKFRFKTLLWGITMKLIFLLIPVVLALTAKSLGYDFTIAIQIVLSLLTVSEVYSIMGNIYMAKNKVIIEKMDVISSMIMTLRKALARLVKGFLHKMGDVE